MLVSLYVIPFTMFCTASVLKPPDFERVMVALPEAVLTAALIELPEVDAE